MSDGILSRWARRKQAARAAEREARADVLPPDTPPGPAAEAAPESLEAAQESPEVAGALAEAIARLPKLEDLTAQTDLAPFLRAGIPSALRNAALRRMWSVDPGIRDFVSEAREYAYDWNTPGGVPGLGPMLPTDDIGAMVERVMRGHAPEAKRSETAAKVPMPASETDETTTPEVAAVTPEDATVPPEDAPEALAHVEPPVSIPPTNAVREFQSPTIVSRLRRHGGAMPS
ncbi:DUF3306 domain-containing protein [Methylobacterium sp. J-068]|uniref:DUF3306 domain-containing protein n=1 Tax=Methylobacterium sp. J-068 TaxID=2836649 RepID=UPI001FB89FE3|nr:DUF3306 domain-containing protein [Methylobacterium sp. J-068]MCJ2037333.1 DUF3306 domain-containing protein [Methylobacterium sp. J-068]